MTMALPPRPEIATIRVDIVDVAEGDHALQLVAGQRQHDGVGAGGEDQLVIGFGDAAFGEDGAAYGIDAGDLAARVQRDGVVAIPFHAVDDDVLEASFRRRGQATA